MAIDKDIAQQRLTRLQGYLAQDAGNVPLLLDIIDTCLDVGDLAQAQTFLTRARAIAPDDLALQSRQGNLLLAEQNWLAAAAVFEHLLRQQGAPEIACNLACAYWMAGRSDDVLALLSPWLPDAPGEKILAHIAKSMAEADPGAQLTLSMLILVLRALHQQDQREAANRMVQTWWPAFSGVPDFLAIASLVYLDSDQLQLAESTAHAALVANPPPFEALLVSGYVALARGDQALAVAQFEAALAIKNDDGRCCLGLGLAHLGQKQFGEAARQLEQAVALIPTHLGARLCLGWCKLLMGDVAGAQAVFRAALAVDRTFGETHGALAVVEALSGQVDAANESIRRAEGLNPKGLAAPFARMLLERDTRHPERFQAEIHALLAKHDAPFGGSLADMVATFGGQGKGGGT